MELRQAGQGLPGDWHSAGFVLQILELFLDGPLPPQGQGAWERGEMGEGLGEVLDFPSSNSLSVSRGPSFFTLA